jgi:hypothetical protein
MNNKPADTRSYAMKQRSEPGERARHSQAMRLG